MRAAFSESASMVRVLSYPARRKSQSFEVGDKIQEQLCVFELGESAFGTGEAFTVVEDVFHFVTLVSWDFKKQNAAKRTRTLGAWCSGRDSDPGLRLERPEYLTGLYYRSPSFWDCTSRIEFPSNKPCPSSERRFMQAVFFL